MNQRHSGAICLGVSLLLLGVSIALNVASPKAVEAQQIQQTKWEYRYVAASKIAPVNAAGERGWEAVCVVEIDDTPYILMKQRKGN